MLRNCRNSGRALAAIALCLLIAACRAKEQPTPTASATPPRPRREAALPNAEQLIRNYHGKVQQKDGGKQKLYLQITSASMSAEGTRFKYTLNAPDRREDDTGPYGEGVLDRTGRVTFGGFSGRARIEGDEVVLESVGIDGPPYWHLVGRPRETKKS